MTYDEPQFSSLLLSWIPQHRERVCLIGWESWNDVWKVAPNSIDTTNRGMFDMGRPGSPYDKKHNLSDDEISLLSHLESLYTEYKNSRQQVARFPLFGQEFFTDKQELPNEYYTDNFTAIDIPEWKIRLFWTTWGIITKQTRTYRQSGLKDGENEVVRCCKGKTGMASGVDDADPEYQRQQHHSVQTERSPCETRAHTFQH